jgi:hypothetical protein
MRDDLPSFDFKSWPYNTKASQYSTRTSQFVLTGILRDTLQSTVYGDTAISCLDILNSALRLLFVNNGANGLCENGELLTAGRMIIEWNDNRTVGFNPGDIQNLLHRPFPYIEHFYVTIENPYPPFDAGSWGSASIGRWAFVLNHWDILKTADGIGFPSDNSGADRLVWVFAAVIMHELMHCAGYDHPDTVSWSAGSDYACTLPYLAGRAVLMRSPYWSDFENGFAIEDGPQIVECRVRR